MKRLFKDEISKIDTGFIVQSFVIGNYVIDNFKVKYETKFKY